MLIHSLICTLAADNTPKYKHATLSSNPSKEKLLELYEHNIATLQKILDFCLVHKIYSYRVPTFLFPLATHPTYKSWTYKTCQELLSQIPWEKYNAITITNHPEQFIVLSSTTPTVVQNSLEEIHFWIDVCSPMPTKLFNLHIGSRSNFDKNMEILYTSVERLSKNARRVLSFENDEKSYGLSDVLKICKELNTMMVLDFHHERCWQKKQNPTMSPYSWDDWMYESIPDVIKTYKDTKPLFHISSPAGGWNSSFMEQCKHADYIDVQDYPFGLIKYCEHQDVILDIEAKKKELAIEKLQGMIDSKR